MRLWLAVAVLLLGVFLPCGTEHNVQKRQIRRGGQTAVSSTAAPEYEYEYEDEEVAPAPPVSYQRRPVSAPEKKPEVASPVVRNEPGTSIRRSQAAPAPAYEEEEEARGGLPDDSPDYALPEPVRLPPGQRKPKTTTKRPITARPYVPDPNNENPDEGFFNAVTTSGPPRTFSRRPSTQPATTTTTTTSAPQTPAPRSPGRRPGANRPKPAAAAGRSSAPSPARSSAPSPARSSAPRSPVPSAGPPPDDIISKILGGQSPLGAKPAAAPARPSRPARPAKPTTTTTTTKAPTTAKPKPLPGRGRQGNRRAFARTTVAPKPTEAPVDEEEDEPEASSPAPVRRVSLRPAAGNRRRPNGQRGRKPTTAAPEDEEVIEKPTTPVPKRTPAGSRIRFAVKPPKPAVVLEQPDDEEDEYEEQSVPREVTQRAPPKPPTTTTTTTTPRPVVRYGNSSRQAASNDKKKFRGRFRPKDQDDEDDGYEERRYRPRDRDRSRGRGRFGSSRYRDDDYDDEDYDDYDDAPRGRNDRGRNKDNGRRRGNRGRGPTTSPRPSTRIPPKDLEKRKDGRIIDYQGDPNFPFELKGFSLVDYPFYITLPEDIAFDCDAQIDGFYASVPHFCQVFHYCHSGNRYSFLCPNYTLYDQTTFTCRFANTVNCPKSAQHYDRNEALYKDKSTEAPITTQLIPDEKPPKKKPSKE